MEFDNDKASRVIQDKRLGELMQTVLKPLNPEAVYFATVHGHRGGIVVFDLQEPAQMPSVAEPLFQELGAEISIQPAMTIDDVTRALV
ncbi:hypothetical protein [Streptacidiphilus fuscans]|nr:hypothetical protein [Streptacidiphilus fuscans]